MTQFVSLRDASQYSLHQIGGKSWRLGYAMEHGFHVPDGFVIPYETLGLRQRSSEVRKQVREQVALFLKKFSGPIAVRSSTTMEDSDTFSGAGLFESILFLREIDEIENAIDQCYSSVQSPLVQRYVQRKGISEFKYHLLLQVMVQPRRAGVLVTNRPEHGQFIAEGIREVGLDVVSGTVTPDFVKAYISNGKILDLKKNVSSSTAGVFDSQFVMKLAKLAREIQRCFSSDQEVEWAEDEKGVLWLIQTRPLTSSMLFRQV